MGHGVPATFGEVWFVDYRNGSDDNDGKSKSSAVKTLSKAYEKAVSNRNDVILIDGDSTVTETAILDWSKNRIHVIGLNGVPSPLGYGNGAKVSLGVTTAATDIATLKVTGVRNTFSNIKFMNSNTVAEGVYCVAEGGEYTRYFNCEFYKSTDLDQAAAAEILMNGDSSQFFNCTIGSNVNAITANGARPCVLLTRETITGKVCRDGAFVNCLFWRKAADTDNSFVHSAAANDVERMLLFKDCVFNNTKLASQTMTVGISGAAALTQGEILVTGSNTAVYNTTNFATQTGIWVAAGAANAANGGEVIQAA
jgi:hypothetical protein